MTHFLPRGLQSRFIGLLILPHPRGLRLRFDDGNRRLMFNANIMTWSQSYGRIDISAKMSWIFQQVTAAQNGIPKDWKAVNTDLLLMQLAIPKTNQLQEPETEIGNASILERHEEQLIIRRKIAGKQHYVCLHGETDRVTIERGEGHEQPDQLQLLYYIDDRSIIMDAGYDRGFILKNSSWNTYSDHNVMAYPRRRKRHGFPPNVIEKCNPPSR